MSVTTGRVFVKEYLKIAGICFVGGLIGCGWRNYKDTNQVFITRSDVGVTSVIALSWHLTVPLLAGFELWSYFGGDGTHKFEFEFTTTGKKKD